MKGIMERISDKRAGEHNSSFIYGYLLILGMTIFWGVSWPIMKIALVEIPPWTFRTISLVCGGIGIMVLAKLSGLSLSVPRKEWLPLLIVSLFNITGWHLGSAHGISLMMAGRAVIIGFTMPLWATIISYYVLGEKIRRQKVVALLLGLTGLGILLTPQLAAIGDKPTGAIFMLIAAVSWGTGTVLIKHFKWSIPTLVLTGWQLSIGSLPVILGTFYFEPLPIMSQLSVKALLSMAYVIVFPMLFCHWAWFSVVKIFPASVAAISTMAIPIIGVLASSVLIGEQIGILETAALALITSAVGIILLWRR